MRFRSGAQYHVVAPLGERIRKMRIGSGARVEDAIASLAL